VKVERLTRDGRCCWLENKVLRGIYREVIGAARDPLKKKFYVILDWISSDEGRIGVDLRWFRGLGIPAVQSCTDLPEGSDYGVVNTGYDSIVHEENALRKRGIEILDKPCPFIRKIRSRLEQDKGGSQLVYLCESNHITIKNYASIFPKDMILVQMSNFQQRIIEHQNGKPFKIIPYVTYLPKQAQEVLQFIQKTFPGRQAVIEKTYCLWVQSKASPLVEIASLSTQRLSGIQDALLICTSGSANRSLRSICETLEERGLRVVPVSSLQEFLAYRKAHRRDRVLLVRSPIPNEAEKPILAYLRFGLPGAWIVRLLNHRALKAWAFRLYGRLIYSGLWVLSSLKLRKARSPADGGAI
jgi:4-hydroxy-3-methylbut-2-enyl diphosphate reductase IspH